jgi:hypothetical protein
MAMIFPGMDPYLEHPVLWTGVHVALIVYIRNALQPLIRPRYVAAIEERVYLEEQTEFRVPDVWIKRKRQVGGQLLVKEADAPVVVRIPKLEIHERYINILDKYAKQKVVTSIEVISPSNKREGPGRQSYLEKQQEIRNSQAHLVEIDLLRRGTHVLALSEERARAHDPYDYLACVNRARELRDVFELYPRKLPQRLPRIAIPLSEKDPDVVLDVQKLMDQVYEDGDYIDRIEYRKPCSPPLKKADQVWANQQIKKFFAKRSSGRNNGKK